MVDVDPRPPGCNSVSGLSLAAIASAWALSPCGILIVPQEDLARRTKFGQAGVKYPDDVLRTVRVTKKGF